MKFISMLHLFVFSMAIFHSIIFYPDYLIFISNRLQVFRALSSWLSLSGSGVIDPGAISSNESLRNLCCVIPFKILVCICKYSFLIHSIKYEWNRVFRFTILCLFIFLQHDIDCSDELHDATTDYINAALQSFEVFLFFRPFNLRMSPQFYLLHLFICRIWGSISNLRVRSTILYLNSNYHIAARSKLATR